MKISYRWLKDYLPASPAFDNYINNVVQLSDILTAVGLEVENIEDYESYPGGLAGLIVGEVLTCEKHPDADKLKVTTVNSGTETLQIVCGAPNVATGQKVVLAQVGSTLHPKDGEPFTIRKAKIRGVESNGMLCAEDEIGIGKSHDGIIVLPGNSKVGTKLSEIYSVYTDHIIEIGLTPNRMDAQSHLGVAKDVCAWLSHHTGQQARVLSPLGSSFVPDNNSLDISVEVVDRELSPRYSGVTISNVNIAPSPQWLQDKLKSLALKPINNVVDITNFILHTTGQPLHAFDADKISGKKVFVETLPSGTLFTTLEGKERKLNADDIMICDGNHTPMCIAGVFGGVESGVTEQTKNIFLESAVFNAGNIRKSMIAHGLRTDAAVRFEKGIDVSKTVEALKYAASLIRELCGGKISSGVKDIYEKQEVAPISFTYQYLERLSGKKFSETEVTNILDSLNFSILEKRKDALILAAPSSNPDISKPADVVEEILRISGLDSIAIPRQVTMTPGYGENNSDSLLKEKITSWLTGNGYSEIFTNSISNKLYFDGTSGMVEIINSLSEGLNVMRPAMLPTGLESVVHNLNRQNKNLLFFEFGKTYSFIAEKYSESNHLAVYCTGEYQGKSWNHTAYTCDIFYLKGIAEAILNLVGISFQSKLPDDTETIIFTSGKNQLGLVQSVPATILEKFSIRQPVFYLDLDYDVISSLVKEKTTTYKPVSKFPIVLRDLAMIVDNTIPYSEIEQQIESLRINKLKGYKMFDLYESDKLGPGKKSIAMSFSFADPQKTLTDKETDNLTSQIIQRLEEKLKAQIRSHA